MPVPPHPLAPPSRTDLARLADKYEALAGLRARRDREALGTAPGVARQELRALSAAFPGCLRELDVLGARELARRARLTRAAAEGAAPEPWMTWVHGYHRLLAGALAAKPAANLTTRTRRARAAAGIAMPAALVARLAAAPRLVPLVLAEVAARAGVELAVVKAAVMPSRQ